MKSKEYSLAWANKELKVIFTDLAEQANGSVLVKYGETCVLATAVMSPQERNDIDFFPLTVDYEERFYAAGRILGGNFIRREGRPSEEAILAGRIIDRTIRPLFDQRFRRDIQVVITVLSIDEANDPDVPAVMAASLALATSDIPWAGPVSAVRLGGDSLTVNPSYEERENSSLDLLLCGQGGKINMIECEAKQVQEASLAKAFDLATSELNKLEDFQKQIIAEQGKTKIAFTPPEVPAEMVALFKAEIATDLLPAIFSGPGKNSINELKRRWLDLVATKLSTVPANLAPAYYEEQIDELVHEQAINHEARPDGRKLNQLRPIFAQAGGLSSQVHGTGIFYRGGTHILSVLTLGGPKDSQIVEGMETRGKKYFMHHYNFPPFSTGETGRLGSTNRRSVGHGALAEKSLRGILPDRETFPYTIRLVSEALASNGSTSMGSVCGSTLALMDGGVPIKAPVAGIAMGLMSAPDGIKYKILTDIQGPEDHHGDMDFKVAGTRVGVTGIQLDIKVAGIPPAILVETLALAKQAREQIIDKIEAAIPAPRATLASSAPAIEAIMVPVDKIGAIIGSGGKVIQGLSADTNTEIEIEDDGKVTITGKRAGVNQAKEIIGEIIREYKPGESFTGQVTRIENFGAFVKIGRDTEGLVHISEIAPFRVNQVADHLKIGDLVPVMIKEIDDKHRLNLSIRAANPNFISKAPSLGEKLPA